MLRLINARLCDKGSIQYGDLLIDTKKGTIVEVNFGKTSKVGNERIIDINGQIVAPGYIDIQNNGVYGLNFSALHEKSTPDDIAKFKAMYRDCMAKFLKTGVTSMCPTVTSNFPEVYTQVLPIYRKSRATNMTDSLGAHLEGPFISPQKKGCHPVETFVNGEDHTFEEIYGQKNLLQNVAIVTVAPEIPGVLDQISKLSSGNVVVSIGHTTLDHKTATEAIARGASMVTHLYNAMPQPHHRHTGVIGLISDSTVSTPHFGLICDGVHVAPEMCVLAFRANSEKCILTTDAMHLIGLKDGTYQWDKQKIVKTGAKLVLEGTDTLAGAATDLSACVANLVRWGNVPLAKAVQTVTNNPADSLGLESKGYLERGRDADLVVLDDEGNVEKVFKLGIDIQCRRLLNQIPAAL